MVEVTQGCKKNPGLGAQHISRRAAPAAPDVPRTPMGALPRKPGATSLCLLFLFLHKNRPLSSKAFPCFLPSQCSANDAAFPTLICHDARILNFLQARRMLVISTNIAM